MSDFNLKQKGGHAFPVPGDSNGYNGMTLRDYFAAQALAMLSDPKCNPKPANLAEDCYAIADAMLAERQK